MTDIGAHHTDHHHHHPRAHGRGAEKFEYGVYFAMLFCVSLPVAVLKRLHPDAADMPDAPHRSLIGEAAEMAHSVTPYLFKR
jgi:hypothetical protein